MISVAKVQKRNSWRYYVRGVAFGDGRRPARQRLQTAQRKAGLPPGVWMGRGLPALGMSAGQTVTQRQMELVFGQGRHPDADRIERELLDEGADPATARRATVLGQPVEEIEKRGVSPLFAVDFTFRAQASLIVLWALGDDRTRRVIERAHERAIDTVLRWLEDEVAETRWSSGRKRAKAPALVVSRWRHFDNRDGFPLLHDHCLILNRAQRPDGTWGALDTRRLYQHIVAAGTLYTLTMTTEVCEELGLATVPREVTPGLRPVMEIAGVDQDLIDWSATRREQIDAALEGITDTYVKKHGRLPGERGRNGLGWWAAQDTRREKKTPKPLEQLRAWWRASAILRFGKQMVDGLLERCQAAGKAIRARVGPRVDTALAAVDVAAIVFTVRRTFARRHVLAEARRHLLETLRGRAFAPGLDDYIADRALTRHARQLTVAQPGRRNPAPDQLTYTADFAWPHRWWIADAGGKPPRESSRYERARVASLVLQNAIRDARILSTARDEGPAATTSAAARDDDHNHDQAAPHAVDHPDRDTALTPTQRAAAVHTHQQAAMPEEYLEGRTTDPATWLRTPENIARLAALTQDAAARRRAVADSLQQTEHPATPTVGPADQQQHTARPDQGRGPGRDR
ncbi:Multifunctional conjugation protein TraI [Streptomyces sp. ADI91-18]|uniref:MobF family relaxase n=1 Tax=Streptomyces sp. ADI91-18 TaxID=1522755 RepID=UPI000F558A11|nr:MobF family relaxase [Streptomyces sp. ADI91-18]RPK23581.1 Multifunctional conjugation protein TraI [Streptomyces sp. ADI91-18]